MSTTAFNEILKTWTEPLTYENAGNVLQMLATPGRAWFVASLEREALDLEPIPGYLPECWYVRITSVQNPNVSISIGTGIGMGWDGREVQGYFEKALAGFALNCIVSVEVRE